MLKKRISGCQLLAVLFLLLQPVAAGGKTLPADMAAALKSLEAVGVHLDNEDWESAAGESRSLQIVFNRLIHRDKTEEETIYRFGYILGSLQVALMNRDRGGSEESLVELHALMLTVANRYDCTVPPALDAIADSLHRCEGCLEGGKFGEIVYRLRRVGRFFRVLYEDLEVRGVTNTELWDFHRRINSVMVAAEVKNPALTGRGLAELREQAEAFAALYAGEAGAPGR